MMYSSTSFLQFMCYEKLSNKPQQRIKEYYGNYYINRLIWHSNNIS